jgi:hypothetical protein
LLLGDFTLSERDADDGHPEAEESQVDQSWDQEQPVHWALDLLRLLAFCFLRDSIFNCLLELHHEVVHDRDEHLPYDKFRQDAQGDVYNVVEPLEWWKIAFRL